MKSIFSVILFSFILIIFVHDSFALNKDDNIPPHINNTPPETIEPKVQPIQLKPTRGQMLYENHCLTCHESHVHIRANTKVKQLSQLHHFVLIRSSELGLQWGDEERDAVTKYLNERFYKLTN